MPTGGAGAGGVDLPAVVRLPAGLIAKTGIGIVAALMGVAGGELLIPTIVLLFAIDIKTAGSLSLVVSLPTMLVASSRDGSFTVLRRHRSFILTMASCPSTVPVTERGAGLRHLASPGAQLLEVGALYPRLHGDVCVACGPRGGPTRW